MATQSRLGQLVTHLETLNRQEQAVYERHEPTVRRWVRLFDVAKRANERVWAHRVATSKMSEARRARSHRKAAELLERRAAANRRLQAATLELEKAGDALGFLARTIGETAAAIERLSERRRAA